MSLCQLDTKPRGSQSRDRLVARILPWSPRDLEPWSSGDPFLDCLPLALLLTHAPFKTSFPGPLVITYTGPADMASTLLMGIALNYLNGY